MLELPREASQKVGKRPEIKGGSHLHDTVPATEKFSCPRLLPVLAVSQQRKSRAGYSFKHQIEAMLADGGIPFETQVVIDAKTGDYEGQLMFPWPMAECGACGYVRRD